MNTEEVKKILLSSLSLAKVYVSLKETHYQIIAVDKIFYKMSSIEKHRIIYAPIASYILNNKIHSISICAFSPEEWDNKCYLYNIKE